jgi:hypothetical protein
MFMIVHSIISSEQVTEIWLAVEGNTHVVWIRVI